MSDTQAVWRTADGLAATRWLASLVAHIPECIRRRSLVPADRAWARTGARFRTYSGALISLPPKYTSGAREMYCRNVYFRVGLRMPSDGWVVDLGANRGLFSVWAALNGAQVVAVEAQEGYAAEIRYLAAHNNVSDRIRLQIALAGGVLSSGANAGVVADDQRWSITSHGGSVRPDGVSVPHLMKMYGIDRISLLKMDIEGGEFAVLDASEDLDWLANVDQTVLEVHHDFGDAAALVDRLICHGFTVHLRDNDGHPVNATSRSLNYAYCHRLQATQR